MKILITFLIIFVFSNVSLAQDNTLKAKTLFNKGYEMAKEGNIDKGIQFMEEAAELDPGVFEYQYEIAYFYAVNEDYDEAINILRKLKTHKDCVDLVYQMLGNCYDWKKEPKEAIKIYDEGLKKFPKSGKLLMERGTMELLAEKYIEGLKYYEQGIEAEPSFPSNYFRAATVHFDYGDPFMGLMYAEIFMNLEKNTKRTFLMSNAIYNFYKKAITFGIDSIENKKKINMNINLNSKNFSLLDSTKRGNIYSGMGFMLMLAVMAKDYNEMNLETICEIRKKMVNEFFQKGSNLEYYNVVFEWQNYLISEKKFDVYNHWVLIASNEKEFKEYYNTHKDEFNSFLKWNDDNYIPITLKTTKLIKKY